MPKMTDEVGRKSPYKFRYRHWVFKLPLARRYKGMVIGRTILFRESEQQVSAKLRRHELIHQKQMDQYGIARFYYLYFRDYLANLWRLRNHDAAYRGIRFETEAYDRELE